MFPYKTFLKHEWTGEEIAAISNYYNGKTNFPEYGVQGYITENIDTLLVDKIVYDKEVRDVTFGTPVVTRINSKNNMIANVYFYLSTETTLGSDNLSCVLPLYFDWSVNKYYPCGDIIITPLGTTADETKMKGNDLMSFQGLTSLSDNECEAAQTFVNNFLTMFYDNQDISPYYDGKPLHTDDLIYNGLDKFEIYNSKNLNGYNCFCIVSFTSKTGLTYETSKYFTIEPSGASWIIHNVL